MKNLLLIIWSVAFLTFIISFLVRLHFSLVSIEGFYLDVVWLISLSVTLVIGANLPGGDYDGYYFD